MQDKYLWLEDILSEESLSWVKERSQEALKKLSQHKMFSEIETKSLEIFASKDKIPYVSIEGDYLYNLWTDHLNIQGLYRRTTIEEFLKSTPHWEILIDLDELSSKENIKWVFNGFVLDRAHKKALVFLSPGGSDADIMREFDVEKKIFVENGFTLPESKGGAHWIDENTIRIERVFDEDSATTSGYARTIRDLKRGESLESAKIIFEVDKTDMVAGAQVFDDGHQLYFYLRKTIDFYHYEDFLIENGQLKKINLPQMSENFGIVNGESIVILHQDWGEYKAGDIISYHLAMNKCEKIFSPLLNQSVGNISLTKNGFYALIDEDVKSSLYLFSKEHIDNWQSRKVDLPANGTLNRISSSFDSTHFFVNYTSFNTPSTYYYGTKDKVHSIAKVVPSFFNHKDILVEQHFVKSLDGTSIPYFLVYKKDVLFNGTNPTILYGYGGFNIPLKPWFDNALGTSWLEFGGVYVIANIRGGGEYGPLWHQAALKEKRARAYEDFFAVAEDLIAKKITSPKNLGAMGGSNGGLLMGVCYTQRPDLFAAINCGVPLLDMHRYHKLLAGASWMAEYGNPDDAEDGAYIRSISPYQNIEENKKYPVIYLNTSTKDDRVHPGHARKLAAKLLEYKHPVFYYENILGGHGGASNFKEFAFNHALDMCFFWEFLS